MNYTRKTFKKTRCKMEDIPLLEACFNGNVKQVRKLLSVGSDVNVQDEHGRTALHWALEYQHMDVKDLDSRNEIINHLVINSINVNMTTRTLTPCCEELPRTCSNVAGETALHLAAQRANEWAASHLLQYGADINCKDDRGRSIMHYAAMSGSVEITTFFLDKGLCLGDIDSEGSMPLHISASNGYAALTEFILDSFGVIDCLDTFLRTPLHLSIYSNDFLTTKLLLDRGADVRLADNDGWTPLHYACVYGDCRTVRLVLRYHPDVNAQTREQLDTPLHLLTKCGGRGDMLQTLLDSNAEVNLANWFSQSPLDCAFQTRNFECISYLLDYGADIYCTTFLFGSTYLLATCSEEAKNKNIDWLILSHTYKLDALENPLRNDVTMLFSLFELIDPEYCKKCFQEVASLKLIKISKEYSLLDLLIVPFKKLVFICKKYVNKIMSKGKFETCFPIYGRMLRIRFQKAMEKIRLHQAGEMFFSLLGQNKSPSLTYDCILIIISYLPDRELNVLADCCSFFEEKVK